MQGTSFSSNPLIQSVVYKSFGQAIKEIGLPEFPEQVFTEEITPRLKFVGSPIPDNQESLMKLWKSILRGKIIATEVWNEEILVFYVRGGFGGDVVDVRLTCQEGQWHVESVVAVYPRPLVHTPWFYRSAYAGLVLVAAILGYAVHHPASDATPAESQYTAMTLANEIAGTNGSTQAASSPSQTTQPAQPSTQPSTEQSTQQQASKPTPRTVTFTLSRGMSLYDLSKFLRDQHLVSDAMKFDMALKKSGADRKIRPGKYTFREGMSESQIIDVLKHGPSK
jgi:hypothetical protein